MKKYFLVYKMRISKQRLLLIFFKAFLKLAGTLILCTFPLFADTLILRNKKVYRGKVVSQTETNIVFKTKEGQQLSFLKKEVLKVVYKDLNEQEARKVISEEEKQIVKKTSTETEEPTPPVTVQKEEPLPSSQVEKRTWFSIAWRSALLPGWGQMKAERYYSGGLAFLLTVGALGNVFSNRNQYEIATNNYQFLSSLTPLITANSGVGQDVEAIMLGAVYNQLIFSNYQNTVQRANNAVLLLGLVYGFQFIHAVFVGRSWEQEATPQPVLHFFKGWNLNLVSGNQRFWDREIYQLYLNYTFRL